MNGWPLNSAVTLFRLMPTLSVVVQRKPSARRESIFTVVSADLEAPVLTLPTLSNTLVKPLVAEIGRSSSRSLVFFR